MKMSKGHQWEISVTGDDTEACMKEAIEIDRQLQTQFEGEG